MKMILSGGLVGPQTAVPPLNQKPAVVETEAKPKEEDKKTQPLLPVGLPRA
jgi:hypothetical protein